MTFNTAVSGLRAASKDLSVIGNNIANVSTTGFKQSRAEFADVYASAALGSGANTVGNGVAIANIGQQFYQGGIASTNNSLDMAINGNGFFILNDDGATQFSRAGIFGLDQTGFVVNAEQKRLQGFSANAVGTISGEIGDLQIETENLQPRQTTDIKALMNVDASQTAPEISGSTAQALGAAIGVSVAGSGNGYPSEAISFTDANGTITTTTTSAADSAAVIASNLNLQDGVAATASTTATMVFDSATTSNGFQINLNGANIADFTGNNSLTAQDIAVNINNLTNTTLRGISATYNNATDTLIISSSRGDDLQFSINNTGNATDTLAVTGTSGAAVTILGDNSNGLNVTVGGTLDVTMDEGITVTSTNGGTGIFDNPISTVNFVDNTFDPADQDTYNHATSMNIFDSLGNSHVMSLYFVKESTPNNWTAYAQIDGEDVGEPNTALPAPQNTEASRASFRLFFNDNGSLDTTTSDPVQITYWNPINDAGIVNGAQTGLTFANGATFPVAEPLTSSNFEIDLSGMTQFGSTFAVNDITQDGYTTGRLTNVDVSQSGIIFARYTNGQSRSLGQVALANFRNQQGLQPIGNSAWVETFTSGNPITGTPGSSSLGALQSGALEESNVDLSEELVSLIEAQRNFQANSKTIQTEDAVTQSIINLR